jgi:hypothetical protein
MPGKTQFHRNAWFGLAALSLYAGWIVVAGYLLPGLIDSSYRGEGPLRLDGAKFSLEHYHQRLNEFFRLGLLIITGGLVVLYGYLNPGIRAYFRQSPLGLNAAVVLYWAVLSAIAVLSSPSGGPKVWQALFFLPLLLLLANLKGLREHIMPLSNGRKLLLLGCLSLLIFAQIYRRWTITYPFVQFTMFCDKPRAHTVTFFEYRGVTGTNETLALNPTEVLPSLRQRRIEGKLRELATKLLATGNPGETELARQDLTKALRGIGTLHNAQKPASLIQAIEVYHCFFELDDFVDEGSVNRELVHIVNLLADGD